MANRVEASRQSKLHQNLSEEVPGHRGGITTASWLSVARRRRSWRNRSISTLLPKLNNLPKV